MKAGVAVKRGTCVYCGQPIDPRAVTCAAHADLPKLDPRYMPSPIRVQAPPCRLCRKRGRRMVKRVSGWYCRECSHRVDNG